MNKDDKIYVAGHRGLAGSAILRELQARGYDNIVVMTSAELDLRDQSATDHFFAEERPQHVFLAAGRVGGILANDTYKAEFLYDNIVMATNVIHSAWRAGVSKLMNLGSSCIYPRLAPQPLREEYLLTGPLETTNQAYAIAKIAAIKLCRYYNEQYGTNFLSVMPTNLYGPHDNFDTETSHVLPAMIRKLHDAKKSGRTVTLWGNGSPKREFLYSDDLASAVIYLMENSDAEDIGEFVNVGSGQEISIKDLAAMAARTVGYEGEIFWDTTKPNGTPRKLLDVSRLCALGWEAQVSLQDGLRKTYAWFRESYSG